MNRAATASESDQPMSTVGVDIGTSSSKGVLVGFDGRVIRSAVREHAVDRPRPGWVEMDAATWWREFMEITHELLEPGDANVVAVGTSGIGPCVLLADTDNIPLRPAILYGIDTRATAQIDALNARFGEEEIMARGGSALSSQAAGAKIHWVAENEPELFAEARRLFMPSSWLAFNLTGEYVLDQHSASQCSPLYDAALHDWYQPWAQEIAPRLTLPPLKWPGEIAGTVTAAAASGTGLPVGIPVITGTIDAWSEAISVGAQNVGDLMLMYGSTMFLVLTVPERLTSTSLWGTVGALPDTRNLAGGMATSGAITSWLRELFGSVDYPQLLREAEESGPGARGLLMLPYFAGERTPIMDPDARGMIAGLTLSHTRGDLYRSALEATGLGIRHNIETMQAARADIKRVIAVGGGTQGTLWTQIVSDITGREQLIRSQTIGACYGAAFLAAQTVSDVTIEAWNPVLELQSPRLDLKPQYDELYTLYRELYTDSKAVSHALAAWQKRLYESSTRTQGAPS